MSLSRTSGVAERYPRWSPDGKTLAYWSDRSGEYELTVRPADGTGAERTVTIAGRRLPVCAALVARQHARRVCRSGDGDPHRRGRARARRRRGSEPGLDGRTASCRPCRFEVVAGFAMAHLGAAPPPTRATRPCSSSTSRDGTRTRSTSGYFNDTEPTFDPDGKYLFFFSNRAFDPVYSDFDNSWTYPNATRIVAATLRTDMPSPLAPRNDVEGASDKKDEDKKAGREEGRREEGRMQRRTTRRRRNLRQPPKPVKIDLEGFESRVVVLPPKAGNYDGLQAVTGKILFRRQPRTGSGEEKSALRVLRPRGARGEDRSPAASTGSR